MKRGSVPYLASRLGAGGDASRDGPRPALPARGGDDVLVIATGLAGGRRAALERRSAAGSRSARRRPASPVRGPLGRPDAGGRPGAALSAGAAPPDLVLGGPRRRSRRLDRQGRLAPAGRLEHPSWCVVRRSRIGLAMNIRKDAGSEIRSRDATAPAPRPAVADLRRPPARPGRAGLGQGAARRGELGRGLRAARPHAGHPRRIGRQAGLGAGGRRARRGRDDPRGRPRDPGRNRFRSDSSRASRGPSGSKGSPS